MDLEYVVNKGDVKDFEKDIANYHIKIIRTKGDKQYESMKELKKDIKSKYSLSEEEFAHNHLNIHFNKICRRRR